MQPQFLRSLFFLILLNVLIKPLWLLGIDRTVQNLAGTAEYGLFFALWNLSMYLQLVLDPGIHTYNNTQLAQNPQKLPEFLSKFVPVKALLSVLYIAVTLLLGLALGFGGKHFWLLLYICVLQAITSFIIYFRSTLQGLHLFRTDSVFSVLDRGLSIIICGFLIYTGFFGRGMDVTHFVLAQIVATVLALLLILIPVFKRSSYFKPELNLSGVWAIIYKTYPFALLTILMTLYSRIDSIMIERLLPDGAYQAGVYASAYRLLDAANMIAFLFATVLLPVFSKLLPINKAEVAKTASVSFKILFIPGLLLVLGAYFFRHPIMHTLYTEATDLNGNVFGLLMPTFLALCTVYVYGTLLTANNNIRFLNTIAAAGFLANVILNAFLIPVWGALGAVAATLVTQAVVAALQYLKTHKLLGLHIHAKAFLSTAIYVIFAVASFYLTAHFIEMKWYWALMALTAANITFAFGIGLIKTSYFLTLIKAKA